MRKVQLALLSGLIGVAMMAAMALSPSAFLAVPGAHAATTCSNTACDNPEATWCRFQEDTQCFMEGGTCSGWQLCEPEVD